MGKGIIKCHRMVFVVLAIFLSLIGIKHVSALTYQSRSDISFNFNPSLNISLSSPDLVIPDLAPGTTSDSNVITVTVNTNSAAGYVLNATVGQATNYETRNLILADSEASFNSIDYGSDMYSLISDSTWGYSYRASGQNAIWRNYSGLPRYDDDTNIATLISTSAAGETNAIDFKIAAKASSDQAAGQYKNVINFIAVANPEPQLEPLPCEPGHICYYPNALSTVEGYMGTQTHVNSWQEGDPENIIHAGEKVTLLASNFAREGYGFAGWSTTYDYSDLNGFYGPHETITASNNLAYDGLSLYAIWVPSAGYLQNVEDAGTACDDIRVKDQASDLYEMVSALTDQRDGETYAIAKYYNEVYQAEFCWMIENLRLESEYSIGSYELLSQSYYNGDYTNNTGSDKKGSFMGLAPAENSGFSDSAPLQSNQFYCPSSSGCLVPTGNAYQMPRYNNTNKNGIAAGQFDYNYNGGNVYSYGNYYTYAAAIASVAPAYSSGSGSYPKEAYSICPANWAIASENDYRGAGAHELNGVWNYNPGDVYVSGKSSYWSTPTADGNPMMEFPYNLLMSGRIEGGEIKGRGSYGRYVTPYVNYTEGNKDFDAVRINITEFWPGTASLNKANGYSVRCKFTGTL